MRTYTVKSCLLHNGKEYFPGDTVELADDCATGLSPLGVVVLADAKPARKTKEIEE